MPGPVAGRMERNMEPTTQTGNVPPGDAAPQSANTNVDATVTTTELVSTPVESDEVRGLKQAADAERKKRQELETQLMQTQGLLSQVAAQIRPQPSPPAEPDHIGLTDQDLLDPAKVRQALLKVRQDAIAVANQSVEQLRFQVQYPDFPTLVGQRDPMTGAFRPSEVLSEALAEDPELQRDLANAVTEPERARIAYRAARTQQRLREARAKAQEQNTTAQTQAAVQRNAINTAAALTQPMSPSAVSGAPSNSPQPDYRAMASNPQTASAFDAIIHDALAGKFG